jgi:hypothetical protein
VVESGTSFGVFVTSEDQRMSRVDNGLSPSAGRLRGFDIFVASLEARLLALESQLRGLDVPVRGLEIGLTGLKRRLGGPERRWGEP